MSKVRVYEVARDLGLENKTLVALFQSIGVTDVKNHMSSVGPDQVDRVKRHIEKQASQKIVEERIRPTVVKRRAAVRSGGAADTSEPSSPSGVPDPSRPRAAAVRKAAPPPVSRPAQSAPRVERPPPPPSAPAVAPEPPPPPVPSAATPAAAAPVVLPPERPPPPPPPSIEPVESPVTPPAPPPPVAPPVQPVQARPSPPSAPAAVAVAAVAPAVASPSPVPPPAPEPQRPSSPPKKGVEVWEGRPGVPMPQAPRGAPTPRRVQYDAKSGTAGGVGQRRAGAMVGGRMGRGPRQRGIGTLAPKRAGAPPVTQERAAHKKVVKIEESIQLQTLGSKMGVKATDVLMKLMQLGMTGVNINSTLDADTAKIVANDFGWEVEDVAVTEEQALEAAQRVDKVEPEEGKEPRPPVVTVMGHVDHGKTSLLDVIRRTNVAGGEAGGITQHIGAYSVDTPRGRITFLDTPGHEAFTAMRARGAQATDVVVLVVAADDGVMPQTKEAVNHARSAKVPIVVAVNKIDKPDAQPERVRRELSEVGLVPEEWGGETLFCEVSAVTKQGIDHLLESVVLQSELLDLTAKPDKAASGLVVEAQLDRGRGPVATVLITDGTLHRGDVLLAGSAWGKLRAMIDDRGRSLASAGPSVPVAIIGLNDVPAAGDPVHVVRDAKIAQQIAEGRKSKERKTLLPSHTKVSLEELAKAMSEAAQLDLKIIVKADVQGSVEAVTDALNRLSTDKVKVTVVHAAAGAITEGDINLAVAAKAIVIGFNVRPAGKATGLAQKEGIEIRQYSIIYDVVDDVKRAMEGLLAPQLVEKEIGKAEVRQLFKISKAGWVAGCMVTQGAVRRTARARLVRDGALIWDGKLSSLKRFKEDVREVKEGFDCGIAFEGFNDIKTGDTIEAYEVEEIRQTL